MPCTALNHGENKMDEETIRPGFFGRLKNFGRECIRVIRVTKKPDGTEFKTIVKVTSIGIAIIGLVGFVIHLIYSMFS